MSKPTLDDYPPVSEAICDALLEDGQETNDAFKKCTTCTLATPGYTLQHPIPPEPSDDPKKDYKGITQAMCNDSEDAKKCCFHDHFGPHTTTK